MIVRQYRDPVPAPGVSHRKTPLFGRSEPRKDIALGLRANWQQFAILVLINALVGALIGLERVALPLAAATEFGIASATAVLAFIATFGLTKAATNLVAGWSVERFGRRNTLIAGWLISIPVPLLILWAPRWELIVAANALLGVGQGLAWSTAVIMKIDLVGPARRGLAVGLNEFAGYVAVAAAALVSGFVAAEYGLRAGPAYLGIGIVFVGLLLTLLLARDTSEHARLEDTTAHPRTDSSKPTLLTLIKRSLWTDRSLFSASQAGFANNLNDGLAWGLFPLFFAAAQLDVREIAMLVSIYPAVWGFSQLWTGAISDRWGRKLPIVLGMILQGLTLVGLALTRDVAAWIVMLIALGIGTALVYPSLIAAVSDAARPSWRASAIGVYRMWRDLGYVAGALIAGVLADSLGVTTAIALVGILTMGSGALFAIRYQELVPQTARQ